MSLSFKDKILFVTGAASGIGAEVVRSFREAGAEVCFCDIDSLKGEALADEVGAHFFKVDVSDAEALEGAMQSVVDLFGDIDIIVNNAGVSLFTPLVELSIEEFDRVINTNLRSAMVTSRFMARHRNNNRSKWGSIINIASTRYLQSEEGSEAYAASKGGVVSLTHALAISLSEYNITVNSISPGWIDTGRYGALSESDHKQHPSQRVGERADIARLAMFIANPANNFLNGENIVADGGMTKRMIYEE